MDDIEQMMEECSAAHAQMGRDARLRREAIEMMLCGAERALTEKEGKVIFAHLDLDLFELAPGFALAQAERAASGMRYFCRTSHRDERPIRGIIEYRGIPHRKEAVYAYGNVYTIDGEL